LLRGMCQPEIVEDVPKETVIQVLQEMVG